MSRIVVTGAAGFIGSRIVQSLLAQGTPVTDLLAVDTSPDFFAERDCTRTFRDQVPRADYRAFLQDWRAGKLRPEKVHHMGASSSTDETRQDYLDERNLNYSKTVWELAVRDQSVLVYASSAATYGGGEHGFGDDPDLIPALRPLNPYGWSKQNFDLFVLKELERGLTPKHWAGLKFFNVYGAGEAHKGGQASVAWHAFRQIGETGRLKLFRSHRDEIPDGEQKRDFVDVADCVDVAIACSAGRVQNGIFNVGSGFARSFLELGHAVFAALGKKPHVEFIPTPEPLRAHYQYYTCADLTRLRAAGYIKPMTALEDGVGRYVKHLKET